MSRHVHLDPSAVPPTKGFPSRGRQPKETSHYSNSDRPPAPVTGQDLLVRGKLSGLDLSEFSSGDRPMLPAVIPQRQRG